MSTTQELINEWDLTVSITWDKQTGSEIQSREIQSRIAIAVGADCKCVLNRNTKQATLLDDLDKYVKEAALGLGQAKLLDELCKNERFSDLEREHIDRILDSWTYHRESLPDENSVLVTAEAEILLDGRASDEDWGEWVSEDLTPFIRRLVEPTDTPEELLKRATDAWLTKQKDDMASIEALANKIKNG